MCIASRVPPTGALAHNPGMCPEGELIQRPFGSLAGTESIQPYQPGQKKKKKALLIPGANYVFQHPELNHLFGKSNV